MRPAADIAGRHSDNTKDVPGIKKYYLRRDGFIRSDELPLTPRSL
jgi:hypothetical protein